MSFLKGLRGRLLVLLGLPVLALMLVSGVSYYGIDALSKSVVLFGTQRIPITSKVNEMEALSHAAPRFMWVALAYDDNMAERKKFITRAMASMEDLKGRIDEYGNYQISPEAREKINGLKDPASKLLELMTAVKAEMEVGTEKEDRKAKEDLVSKMPQYAVKLSEGFNQLSTIASKRNGEIVAAATSQASTLVYSVVILAILAISVSIVFGLIMAMRLSSSLTRINSSVGSSSEQVSAASDQISNASQQLASASQEQASALEETAASLEELSGMVENNMKSAESSTLVAESVREAVDKSDMAMKDLTRSMEEILESNKRIENLVKVIEEIGEKTAVIDEIVFQTKLLSFNASVEAERAGEHGRGFAVVAQEVGNLAQMSGKSALEISAIVKSSVKEAHEISTQNKERVQMGHNQVTGTATYLQEVQMKVESLLDSAKQILNASREQNSGIKQINVSMDNLNKTTQSTAATAEEAASAAEELNSQAYSLQELVGEMTVIVSGADAHEKPQTSSVRSGKKSGGQSSNNVRHLQFNKSARTQASAPVRKMAVGSEAVQPDDDATEAWDKL